MIERKYYLVHETGKSIDAIHEFLAEACICHQSVTKFMDEIGAKNVWSAHQFIVGFSFEADPGKGWRPSKRGKYFIPDQRTKAGKTIAQRMSELKDPGAESFCRILGAPYMVFKGNRFASTIYKKIGAQFVISVPIGDDTEENNYHPPDTTPLKLSEYHAMKEAVGERKAACADDGSPS